MTNDQMLIELSKMQDFIRETMDDLRDGDVTEPLSPTVTRLTLLMLAGHIGKLATIITADIEKRS